jgi:hypothetical protein
LAKFGFVQVANEEEYRQKYLMYKILNGRFKKAADRIMPDYIAGNIYDMGIRDVNISGVRMCIPPIEDNNIKAKRLNKSISYCMKTGIEVLAVDSSIDILDPKIEGVSKGLVYSPVVIINAVKSVAALLGIDFNRCSICIADASTNVGLILAEYLSSEVQYMTLLTPFRETALKSAYTIMKNRGLSPAVMADYKKALDDCDILLYVGGIDINELVANIHRKMVIANFTSETLNIEKDILIVDDAVLKGAKKPIIGGSIPQLTSRIWEGALLTQLSIDVDSYTADDMRSIGSIAEKLSIDIKTILSGGRPIGVEGIYRYR